MSDGSTRPIAFASRTLQTAEKNYSQLDKEALSVLFGVKRFHQYLWGRYFDLHTDHKPLVSLLGENKGIQQMFSPRMQRWALTLSAYNYKIFHIPGTRNCTADALSRLPVKGELVENDDPYELVNLMQYFDSTPLTSDKLRMWTDRDPTLSLVKRFVTNGWPGNVSAEIQPFASRKNELSLHDGCLFWGGRVIPPAKARPQILRELHDSHTGIARTKALARSYCWWPHLDSEIENLLKTCDICQTYQRNNSPGPVHPWRWPDKPWHRVHADYFGPINGTMFLLIIDAYSKWIDVYPVHHATTETTITKMRSSFAVFGIPETLCTDNGTPFVSSEFEQFLTNNGIKHIRSAPYHPSSNGLAERAVQTVKNGLRKQQNGTIQTKLDRFLFSYRVTPSESTGKSPAELMFGRSLRTRLNLLFPNPRARVEQQQQRTISSEETRRDILFRENDPVYTRLPHETCWTPATVRNSTGSQNTVELPDGRIACRHSDHVRSRVTDTNQPTSEPNPIGVSDTGVLHPDTSEILTDVMPRRSQRTPKPVDRFQPGI